MADYKSNTNGKNRKAKRPFENKTEVEMVIYTQASHNADITAVKIRIINSS